MKYTTTAVLALATTAAAKVAHNKREVKRDPSSHGLGGGFGGGFGAAAVGVVQVAPIVAIAQPVGIASPLLLLYTNQGGGVANNVVNSQVTVTQTVTVPQGGVATQMVNFEGATQTLEPGATGTFPVTGTTHEVTVGGGLGTNFFPADIQAQMGDVVLFNFMAQNHSVTQSSFENPCFALEGGMDSGFMENPDNSVDPPPQVAMQVMTTEPLWMYCAQGMHCQNGMVLSINPTIEKTHAQFQQLAIALKNDPAPAIAGGAVGGVDGAPPPVDGAPPADAAPVNVDPNQPANLDPNLANPNLNLPDPAAVVNNPNDPNALGSVATGALTGGIVMGLGTVNEDGSCNCAVQCGAGGSVAAPADVGVNGFGGEISVIDMSQVGGLAIGSSDTLGAATVDPLSAATVDPLSASTLAADPLASDPLASDPLAAASIDPLAGASIDPLGAAPSGLVAPDSSVIG